MLASMALNRYITLGRSGLRVSPLCLGTMTFGLDWGWGSSPEEARAILDAYTGAGGNFIDTANIYTKGHSEKIIGEHLAPTGASAIKRDRLVIATKFYGNLYPGDPNAGGGARKNMLASCEQSLRRLKTDYIDLYWLHAWDRFTPIDETMRALDDLVRAGKVRYIGFSDVPAWKCAQAQLTAQFRGWSPLIALQIEYSLLERTVEGDLVPMALELGLGITPWSPLKGGVLTGKYSGAGGAAAAEKAGRGAWVTRSLTDRAHAVVDVLKRVAQQAGASPSQTALAWLGSKAGVASTIIGARTMDQLNDNLGSLKVVLTPSQLSELDAVSTPALSFPHDFLNFSASFMQGGTTVNGRPSDPWPLAPTSDAERH